MSRFDWMADAACAGMPVETFFVDTGRGYGIARDACSRCPVLAACRAWNDGCERGVVSERQVAGFFAGETPEERIARRQEANGPYLRPIEPGVLNRATRIYGSRRAAAQAYAEFHNLSFSAGYRLFERLAYGQRLAQPDTHDRLMEFLDAL